MIELLVAMVLMTIAFGMVAAGVISAFQGSGSARAGSISDAAVARASGALGDDVSRAETLGRSQGLLRDPAELAAAVRSGTFDPMSSDAGTAGPVDIDEFVVATPTRLVVLADVMTTPGVECVEWESAVVGADYRIQRTVLPPTCAGDALDRRVLLDAPAAATDVVKTPFSYELVCNRGLCGADSKAAAATPCRPWNQNSVSGKRLRWIVGVRATFSSVSVEGKAVSRGSGTVKMSARSRDTQMYRTALGC